MGLEPNSRKIPHRGEMSMLREEWKEMLVGLIGAAIFSYFLFTNEKVIRYIHCEDVPVYERNWERCY